MTNQNPYGQQPQPGQPQPGQQPYAGQVPPQGYYQQPPAPQKKPFYKRVWFIILAVIVVIGIIIAATSGGDDKKTDNNTPAPSSAPTGEQSGGQSADNIMQLVLESDGAPINATWLQNGNTAQEQGVASGWTKDIPVDNKWDAIMNNVTGQLDGSGSLTCRILWNGNVITESTSSGDYAVVTCSPDLDKM